MGRCKLLATGKVPGSQMCLKSLGISHLKVISESMKSGFCFSSSGIFTLVIISLLDFVRGKDPIAQ